MTVMFLIVDEVTILEPNDNEILSQIMPSDNVYRKLTLLMKLDIQTFCKIQIYLKCLTFYQIVFLVENDLLLTVRVLRQELLIPLRPYHK